MGPIVRQTIGASKPRFCNGIPAKLILSLGSSHSNKNESSFGKSTLNKSTNGESPSKVNFLGVMKNFIYNFYKVQSLVDVHYNSSLQHERSSSF
jgi:hypothetical protein